MIRVDVMNASDVVAEASRWFEGKSFTADWTSHNFPVWAEVLKPLQGRAARILEIGSWEGRSALFFLNYLPQSQIICIDTFAGGKEYEGNSDYAAAVAGTEKRFDQNLVVFAGRVTKIKARSIEVLPQLGLKRERFDLIYVDGSHIAADVYADAVLSWDLLESGGTIIFDDYLWDDLPDEMDRPKPAIDAFMLDHEGEYQVLNNDYQMILRKR